MHILTLYSICDKEMAQHGSSICCGVNIHQLPPLIIVVNGCLVRKYFQEQ